jgi:hypothetical protein
MQKEKNDYLQKYFFKYFEFSVTENQTRAQGFKSKTPTHPAMEAYTKVDCSGERLICVGKSSGF